MVSKSIALKLGKGYCLNFRFCRNLTIFHCNSEKCVDFALLIRRPMYTFRKLFLGLKIFTISKNHECLWKVKLWLKKGHWKRFQKGCLPIYEEKGSHCMGAYLGELRNSNAHAGTLSERAYWSLEHKYAKLFKSFFSVAPMISRARMEC